MSMQLLLCNVLTRLQAVRDEIGCLPVLARVTTVQSGSWGAGSLAARLPVRRHWQPALRAYAAAGLGLLLLPPVAIMCAGLGRFAMVRSRCRLDTRLKKCESSALVVACSGRGRAEEGREEQERPVQEAIGICFGQQERAHLLPLAITQQRSLHFSQAVRPGRNVPHTFALPQQLCHVALGPAAQCTAPQSLHAPGR